MKQGIEQKMGSTDISKVSSFLLTLNLVTWIGGGGVEKDIEEIEYKEGKKRPKTMCPFPCDSKVSGRAMITRLAFLILKNDRVAFII